MFGKGSDQVTGNFLQSWFSSAATKQQKNSIKLENQYYT